VSLLERPFHLLPRAARHRAFWLGLPLLLYVWTLGGPFLFDDLHLLLKTERYIAGESSRLDLFRFAPTQDEWRGLRDRGTYPWWAPEVARIDLFRPIAEWSFYLDTRLFGRNAAGHRVISLAWFALALICVHRLYLAASKNLARAGAATFFFGISQTVSQPVTFISNRSDLLVVVGTTLAAWAYWRAASFPVSGNQSVSPEAPSAIRKARSSVFLVVLAGLGFAFALLSKETAVALAGVIVIHELIVRWRRFPTGSSRTRTVITGTLSVLAVAYLAYYATTRQWHLGLSSEVVGQNSILAEAPRSLLLYFAVWTVGFPISVLLQATDGWIVALAAVGGVGALIVAWHLRSLLRPASPSGGDPASSFFVAWAAMFLLPALLTNPETRVLCPATIGWAYLLAILLTPRRESGPWAPLWVRHWLLASNGGVSIACAIGVIIYANSAERQARRNVDRYMSAQHPPLRDGDTLIVAEPESALELICAGDRLEFLSGRKNVALAYLTLPDTNAKIGRMDDHTLLLTSSGPLMGTPMQRRILGSDWKPRLGDTFRLREFTAEITAVADDDTVTALRFGFVRPLTSPRLHFHPPELAETARGSASAPADPAAGPEGP
jgi:hypothetical protein